jgi:hypothetical protein
MASFIWRQMRHNLMAIKIEVNPFVAGTTFWATQQVTIKRARSGQRGNWESKVKWLHVDSSGYK